MLLARERAILAQLNAEPGTVVAEVLRRRLGVRESLELVVAEFARESPAVAGLEEILRLDFERDTAVLAGWFAGLMADEPPPPAINALWFGLFNQLSDAGERGSVLYAAGSQRYGGDPEWTCQLTWWPRQRYAPSTVQSVLPAIGYRAGDEAGWLADYALTLAHAAASVNTILEELGAAAILDGKPSLGIAVRHDSGDALVLGVVSPGGLDASSFGWV